MEPEFFGLNSPATKLVMSTWNVNGVANKLENDIVQMWINTNDIVFLNKTKTMKTFSVPGYEVYTNSQSNRGGVAVLLRNN